MNEASWCFCKSYGYVNNCHFSFLPYILWCTNFKASKLSLHNEIRFQHIDGKTWWFKHPCRLFEVHVLSFDVDWIAAHWRFNNNIAPTHLESSQMHLLGDPCLWRCICLLHVICTVKPLFHREAFSLCAGWKFAYVCACNKRKCKTILKRSMLPET